MCGVCDMVSIVDDELLLSKCLLLVSKVFGRKEVEVSVKTRGRRDIRILGAVHCPVTFD